MRFKTFTALAAVVVGVALSLGCSPAGKRQARYLTLEGLSSYINSRARAEARYDAREGREGRRSRRPTKIDVLGACKLPDGRIQEPFGEVWTNTENPYSLETKKIPSNITGKRGPDGCKITYYIKEGQVPNNPNDLSEGAMPSAGEFLFLHYIRKGENEQSFVGVAKGTINLDDSFICAELLTPDENTRITYFSLSPDGKRLGKSSHKPGVRKCMGKNTSKGDYLDEIMKYMAENPEGGIFTIVAEQDGRETRGELNLKGSILESRVKEPEY